VVGRGRCGHGPRRPESQAWDQIAVNAPYYLIVKAAGNDRSDIGPSQAEPYLVVTDYNEETGVPTGFESTLSRPFDCAPAGYDCMPGKSVAKNILTVGAVEDLPGGYATLTGPGQVLMTPFSSWGPTDDGRIKPDVVGNGSFLLSTYPTDTYAAASGTSMAAPNVTGSLLLVQQHYELLNSGSPILAATLKALAIHTAEEAGSADGPDYEFGWGLLNVRAAANVLTPEPSGAHTVIEDTLADGVPNTHPISVSVTDATVRATLVWTDPPGSPVIPQVLDDATPQLVNDLDLRVTDANGTHLPWTLDPANPSDPATRGDNTLDNVEQVVIVGGAPGTYTVQVSHKGNLQGASQDYSLIVSSVSKPPVGTDLVIDEDFSGGLPAGWSTGGVGAPWEIRTPVPGDNRYDNYTLGSGQFAMVDVDYSQFTDAWLQLPELNLSTAEGVLVRFQSYHRYDTWETLILEVSTDGGANYGPVWTYQGFNPLPTPYQLDVTAEAAGEPSVLFRFRFDSWVDPVGDLWQLDDIQVEAIGSSPPDPDPGPDPVLPGQASNPVPEHESIDQPLDSVLDWTAGAETLSHEVYFGTTQTLDAGDWQGAQATTGFDPGPLAEGQTYYWRIDEVNGDGSTAGDVWQFTTISEPDPPPPPPDPGATLSLTDLVISSLPGNKGRWSAEVVVEVQDGNGLPAGGVTVNGNWGGNISGGDSCDTGPDGRCALARNNLKNNVILVSFEVTSLVKPDHTYDPDGNLVAATVTLGDGGGGEDPPPDPDPPPTGDATLTLTAYKVKGIQHVDLAWTGLGGAEVSIHRDNVALDGTPTTNDGDHTDNIGVKGGGSYLYRVCEAGTSTCVSGTAVF
jgi:hypothetical protein